MKQLICCVFVLLLWVAAVVLWAVAAFVWLFAALFLLHLLELLFIGYRLGRIVGKRPGRVIVLCMLFGICWWLPIRKEIRENEFDATDFIEDGREPWREHP